jgi:hypothetical protein
VHDRLNRLAITYQDEKAERDIVAPAFPSRHGRCAFRRAG